MKHLLSFLLALWVTAAFSQPIEGSLYLKKFFIEVPQESGTDEPYLTVIQYRTAFGKAAQVTWNPTIGPGSMGSMMFQDTLLLGASYRCAFPDLKPYEAYGVMVIAFEKDMDKNPGLGELVRTITGHIRSALDNQFRFTKAPDDPVQHTRQLLKAFKTSLYTLDDANWPKQMHSEHMDVWGDNDDLIGHGWVCSVYVPQNQASSVNSVAHQEAGFSPRGISSAHYRFKDDPSLHFTYGTSKPVVLQMALEQPTYKVLIEHRQEAAASAPVRPQPVPPTQEPTPAPKGGEVIFTHTSRSVYVMPDYNRVDSRVYTFEGKEYVALDALIAQVGYLKEDKGGNTISLYPKNAAQPAPPATPRPAQAPVAETITQSTPQWQLRLHTETSRVSANYDYQYRKEVTPYALQSPTEYLLLIDGFITNLSASASEVRISGQENAVIGTDGQTYPLDDVDAHGPYWESGRITSMLPGTGRPLRLIFRVPDGFQLKALRVVLPGEEEDQALEYNFR